MDIEAIQAVLEAMPYAAMIVDASGVVRYTNRILEQLWPGQITTGMNLYTHPVLNHLYSADGKPLSVSQLPFSRTLETGQVCHNVELVARLPSQPPQYVLVSSAPIMRGGKPQGAVLTLEPRTEFHTMQEELARRNAALQALNDLATRLLNLNTADRLCEAALDGVLAIMGARRGCVVLTDDHSRRFRMVAYRGYTEETCRLADRLLHDVLSGHNRARETKDIVVVHSDDAPPLVAKVLAVEKAHTAVLVPVLLHDRVVGVLSYLLDEHRELTTAERELLRTASTYVGAALERAQLYEEAESERARLSRLLEELPVGVFVAEGEPELRTFRWVLINRTGQQQFEAPTVTPGPVSEKFTILHPDGRVYTEDELPLQHAIWTGTPPPEQELIFRYHDGHERVFLSKISIFGYDGTTRQAIAISEDITERKHLENQVRAYAETLKSEYDRLAYAVSNIDIAISIVDRAGRIILVNQAWEQFSGRKREEVIGLTYGEIMDPAFAAQGQAIIDYALRTGQSMHIREFYYEDRTHPDGIYIDGFVQPLLASDGQVEGVIIASIEVTEKVRARQQLEQRNAVLRAIFEAAPVGLVLGDAERHIVDFNAMWARIMGIDPDIARGRLIYEVAPSAREREDLHLRVLAGESVDLAGMALKPAHDDRVHYYDVHMRPVRDASGQVVGILSVVIDVTERYLLDRQKDEFIALASHELKTPVTAIKGYAQVGVKTAHEAGNDRLVRILGIIVEQSNRLTRLVNELLDVSRMESGELEFDLQEFDLVELVREVVGSLELTAPEFAFNLHLPADPVMVHADRHRIEQVITNLVQNAVKYSGDSRKIDVSVLVDGEEAVIGVRDYGVGIPATQQPHIFERFYRASNVRTHRSGLGLGLYISHNIVRRHGGRMWLESIEGKGSTFYFSLPRTPSQMAAQADAKR
jgi:PAS domain S-box-containing protein